VRCPQQAAVSRSEGEVGTGVGRNLAPLDPALQRPPCQSGGGREKPRRPVPGPSGRGRSVVGGRVGGQAAGSAAGEGVGGRTNKNTRVGCITCYHMHCECSAVVPGDCIVFNGLACSKELTVKSAEFFIDSG
jgi:hypothetical protein